jgi:hypothetical protein
MAALVPTGRDRPGPHSEVAMPERHGDQVVETTTEARAAETGTGLRWMLIGGTLGVAVIFALLGLYYFT